MEEVIEEPPPHPYHNVWTKQDTEAVKRGDGMVPQTVEVLSDGECEGGEDRNESWGNSGKGGKGSSKGRYVAPWAPEGFIAIIILRRVFHLHLLLEPVADVPELAGHVLLAEDHLQLILYGAKSTHMFKDRFFRHFSIYKLGLYNPLKQKLKHECHESWFLTFNTQSLPNSSRSSVAAAPLLAAAMPCCQHAPQRSKATSTSSHTMRKEP